MSEFDDDSTPPRAKRPKSHWGDEERVTVGKARRTSPHGVPIVTEDRHDRDFTPVTDLLDLIEDPQQRKLFRLIWEHTANMEMRFRQRIGTEHNFAELRADFANHQDECITFKVDLVGKDGTDGKIGTLRDQLHALTKRAWWLLSVAIGAVGVAAIKLFLAGAAYGDIQSKVTALEERVQLIESATFLRNRLAPAFVPEKVQP